jgi:flagellar biosynthesis/type III secretory pathway protein FliH
MSYVRSLKRRGFIEAVVRHDHADMAEREADLERRVKLEVGRLREMAFAEGWASGETAAKASYLERKSEVARLQAILEKVIAEFSRPLQVLRDDIADFITECSSDIARHVVSCGLEREVSLRQVVGEILNEIDESDVKRIGVTEIRVNPDDVAFLGGIVGDQSVKVIGDNVILPGGVLVEIIPMDGDSRNRVGWDALIETKFELFRQALGIQQENQRGFLPNN